ncbi:MAG: hypothetical protein ACR2FV_07915 [Ornithinimicrobium sp.]|uniref:hypothetical protein n=1 Tax=Ornithinimicrobium sp. TaxID=1977084 RepID=UPI0017ABC784|nr:hypothetical protein [Actinomycetota bacterium]
MLTSTSRRTIESWFSKPEQPAEQEALLARVRVAVAEELPPGADDDPLDLPWVTTSLRYRRES